MTPKTVWSQSGLLAVILGSLLFTGGAIALDSPSAQPPNGMGNAAQILQFDVAEDASRFVFDESPVLENGMPSYGNPFVTQGYIYPPGTLTDSNGVLANGDPEFPDQVMGQWTCRGWFIGEGAATETGPWVISHQLYSLGDRPGSKTLTSEGYELPEPNVPFQRAIVGGTGPYRHARGQVTQTFLGFNPAEGVNLRFQIEVES
ncbi:hypothetical protein [Halomicronema hongdechloris]|nr:hypothetical protein [Halomicronema hongdechloris]